MANLSDAVGKIKVEKVGAEFIEYIKKIQNKEAYYLLIDEEALAVATPDADNNLSINFATFGRWSYEGNINGYIDGEWMHDEEQKSAYNKFIAALIEKDGSVSIEYTDSDIAMDFMGTGESSLYAEDGEKVFHNDFDCEEVSIAGYSNLYGDDEEESLLIMYGDNASEARDLYLKNCLKSGEKAVSCDDWYTNIYEAV